MSSSSEDETLTKSPTKKHNQRNKLKKPLVNKTTHALPATSHTPRKSHKLVVQSSDEDDEPVKRPKLGHSSDKADTQEKSDIESDEVDTERTLIHFISLVALELIVCSSYHQGAHA
jgi:hypothetical protein